MGRLLGRSRNFTIYKYNIIHHTVKVHSNMAANQVLVGKLYRGVMEEVVSHVRDAFLDEGADEAVLQELKQIWENKLGASKVIDPITDPAETSLQNRLQQSHQSSASGVNQASQQSAAQNKQGTNKTVTSGTSAVQNTVAAPAVRMVPVQITVPAHQGVPNSTAKSITVQVPAHALQGGEAGKKLQAVLSSPTVTAALALPVELATNVLQQHINAALQPSPAERTQPRIDNAGVQQLDGPQDSSDEEEDDAEDEEDDADDDDERDENEENPDEEPLNSEDDVSDEDPGVLFETENVVVCQYDKITRSRNRWKFHLKDGIMNINGRDYVFQRANGDAEW